jgi:hypothetical protein
MRSLPLCFTFLPELNYVFKFLQHCFLFHKTLVEIYCRHLTFRILEIRLPVRKIKGISIDCFLGIMMGGCPYGPWRLSCVDKLTF